MLQDEALTEQQRANTSERSRATIIQQVEKVIKTSAILGSRHVLLWQIDYSRLTLQGLGPDVNDLYLREMCQMVSRDSLILSAAHFQFTGFMGSRVARDDRMRHKGYGFANYETVTQGEFTFVPVQTSLH